MEPKDYKGLIGPGQRPFAVSLHLPSIMMQAQRCSCALVLVCLLSLLLPPEGALGEKQPPQELPEPRSASWFSNFNKFFGKILNDSWGKLTNQKKPTDATKPPPSNTTKLLTPSSTKSPPRSTLLLQRPPTTPPGPR